MTGIDWVFGTIIFFDDTVASPDTHLDAVLG